MATVRKDIFFARLAKCKNPVIVAETEFNGMYDAVESVNKRVSKETFIRENGPKSQGYNYIKVYSKEKDVYSVYAGYSYSWKVKL